MRLVAMPTGEKYKVKNDRYKKTRGRSQMLAVSCSQCSHLILIYQKDGPGPLLRCYLDRIAWPEKYPVLSMRATKVRDLSPITCENCSTVISVPILYEKEKRLAYNNIPTAFKKTHYKPNL